MKQITLKKNNALKFKILQMASLIAIILAMMTNSCKKDANYLKKEDTILLSTWYETHVLGSTGDSEFKKYRPVWDNIYLNNTKNELVFEVELENPEILVLTNGTTKPDAAKVRTLTRLLLFQDKITKNIKYATYMYLEGDVDEDLRSLHYKKLNKFTGRVVFFHQDGQMANGWIYNEGKALATTAAVTKQAYLKLQHADGTSGRGKIMQTTTECRGQFVQSYFWGCVGAEGHQTCSWHSSGTKYITICRTVQLGGEQETIDHIAVDETGGYWPANLDCAGVENGSAFQTDDCGCIGGNTGITECGGNLEIKSDSIKMKYPCAGKLLDDLIADTGMVSFFKPFIQKSSRPDLIWRDSTLTWNLGGTTQFGV